ncbi:MAG: cytochrome c-type biogenesis protein [Rubrivivax sp.]
MRADLLALLLALLLPWAALANEARPAADDPVVEARMLRITAELRCLVCQNQTVADSHSGLADDLRRQVREMINKGSSDQQIIDFMTARYGDFVLYRPPVKTTTALLWYGPAALLALGLAALVLVLRRRNRLAPEAFEPDPDETR